MTSSTLPGKLIFHPFPDNGEGLNGYLSRLAEGNHLCGLQKIIVRGSSEVEELSNRLGVSSDHAQLAPLSIQSKNDGRAAYRVWNNQTSRYCPECLRVHALWKQEWELAIMTVCSRHGRLLIDTCKKCGDALTWKRQRLFHCDCGAGLKHAEAENADKFSIELAKCIQAKHLNQMGEAEHLDLLTISQLHDLVIFIGAYARDAGSSGKRMKIARFSSLQTAHAITQSAAAVLMDWPSGLYKMLDELSTSEAMRSSTKLSVRFGPFYRYFFRTFTAREYGPVIHAFESYLEKNWTAPLAKRNRCLSPTLRKNHVWVPAHILAKELNTSRKQLLRLHEEGRIAGHLTKTPGGRSTFCVDRREILLIKGLLHDLIDMQTTCEILGISKNRVIQLAEHALLGKAISPNKKGYGKWALSRKYMEAMPLFGGEWIPVNENDHPDKVSLAFALKYLLYRRCLFPRLLIAVIEEKILPRGQAIEHTGIAAWLFDRAELETWIELQNQELRAGALSVVDAAKKLKLKQEVAYHLVRRGILGSYIEEDTGQMIVGQADIEKFNQNYISTGEIALRIGGVLRASAIPSYLESRGIKPYAGPTIDSCRQYLYQRSAELDDLIDRFVQKGVPES